MRKTEIITPKFGQNQHFPANDRGESDPSEARDQKDISQHNISQNKFSRGDTSMRGITMDSASRLVRARGVAHLIEQVCRFAYEDKRPEALHSVQWAALRYFSRANEQVRTVNGLAKYLGVTSAPASRTSASLVKRGLITMRQSPKDARSNIFTLTDTGQALLPDDPIGKVATILSEMEEVDLARLASALDAVHTKLLD